MEKNSKIYVAGHNGMVGSAIVRNLENNGYHNIIVRDKINLDLMNQIAVNRFFREEKPEYVFLAAALVGGIQANNDYPADFILNNTLIQALVVDAAYRNDVKKLVFLGSSCIYPKITPQPIKEEFLLTGLLEPTNDAYAIAKISGIRMCQAFHKQYGFNAIALMPTNLYGINDNLDLETSHLLPALIRKFHEAKINNKNEVVVWGTGNPRREMMHVDDLADAAVFLMDKYDSEEIINVGTGKDLSIREIAEIVKDVVDFKGDIVLDTTKPDGTYQKLLDVSKLNNLGWEAGIDLYEGVKDTYEWYINNNE